MRSATILRAVLAALFVALGATPAVATPITMTTTFSFSGFSSVPGAQPPPFATLSGTVTVTIQDPSANATNVAVDAISFGTPGFFAFDPANVRYDYDASQDPPGAQAYLLQVHLGNLGATFGTNDFVLELAGLSSPSFAGAVVGDAVYAVEGSSNVFLSSSGSLSSVVGPVGPPVSAVPEPATLSALAIGAAGAAVRSRRAASARGARA